jgi:membrane protein CcdC involved in cytochrome C biogenesis
MVLLFYRKASYMERSRCYNWPLCCMVIIDSITFLHKSLVFNKLPYMYFLFMQVGIIPWLVLTSRVSKFLCKMLPEDLFVWLLCAQNLSIFVFHSASTLQTSYKIDFDFLTREKAYSLLVFAFILIRQIWDDSTAMVLHDRDIGLFVWSFLQFSRFCG